MTATPSFRVCWRLGLSALAFLSLPLGGMVLLAQPTWAGENTDPAKVVTAEACGECHVSALEVWKKSTHATGFKTLHRKESAAAIAERMGFKLIKRDSVCIDCHYTPTERNDQLRAVSGVSCESCHGAGRDWLDLHNDYGGKDIDHNTESPQHRLERRRQSEAAGMRLSTDLYAIASSCYRCHTVPNEKLVNVGRHSLGSSGFELVDWSQGEVRHNFLDSFLNGDGTKNAERPPPHDRRLYVVGRSLDVEHSLRGLAEATEKGVYLKAMQRRLRSAVVELRAIAQTVAAPEVDTMISIVRATKPGLGQREALLAAADQVAAATKGFLKGHDGTQLAALDPLLESGADAVELLDDEVDLLDDEVVLADNGSEAEGAGVQADGTQTGAQTAGENATDGSAPVVTRIEAIAAEGKKRQHIRPRPTHDTLAVTACQQCHGDQNAWWFDDSHYASIDPFLDRAAKQSKIARLYGISPAKMARGESLCMDCHGTFATGKEKREVQDGVSCQSCHGSGADFLEPHQDGEKSQGRQRPGFQKALKLGMNDLGTLDVRLRNCASCHYITDPRLLSAGHPSGARFDIVAGMTEIRHWEKAPEAAAPIQSAYAALLSERGPVPKVRLARLAETRTVGGTRTAATGSGPSPLASLGDASRPRQEKTLRPRPTRRSAPRDSSAATDYDLPPLPETDESTPIEEVLRLVQEQLKKLYRIVVPPDAPVGEEP